MRAVISAAMAATALTGASWYFLANQIEQIERSAGVDPSPIFVVLAVLMWLSVFLSWRGRGVSDNCSRCDSLQQSLDIMKDVESKLLRKNMVLHRDLVLLQSELERFKLVARSHLMPIELTAENGAKHLMIGEFFEEAEVQCPECYTDPTEDCEVCAGSGSYIYKVAVSWDTIKKMYAKLVEHFGHPSIGIDCEEGVRHGVKNEGQPGAGG